MIVIHALLRCTEMKNEEIVKNEKCVTVAKTFVIALLLNVRDGD